MSIAVSQVLAVSRNQALLQLVAVAARQRQLTLATASTYWIGPHLRHAQPNAVLLDAEGWKVPARSVVLAVSVLVQALSQARLFLVPSLPGDELQQLRQEFLPEEPAGDAPVIAALLGQLEALTSGFGQHNL